MKTHKYAFEKLEVWQKSKSLALEIYRVCQSLPKTEQYGLISQITRSAISICSNIAEGTARVTKKDQAHFSSIAYSSLMELLNQIIIAYELAYIDEAQYQQLRSDISKISFQLNNLRNSQIQKI